MRDLAAITDEYLDEQGIILALILASFTFVNKFPSCTHLCNAVCTYAYVYANIAMATIPCMYVLILQE